MTTTLIRPTTQRTRPVSLAPPKPELVEPRPPAPKKRGRKSDAQRIEAKMNAEKAARLAEQEKKRAQPFDPLTKVWLYVSLTVGAVIFATSALFSFAAVAASADWMQPEWPWLTWVVPGFLELFIIWFGFDSIMNQAKGNRSEAKSALVWMFVFASVAVIANSAHTIDAWGFEAAFTTWQAWIGTLMAALAPLSVVLITKRVSKLVFAEPEDAA